MRFIYYIVTLFEVKISYSFHALVSTIRICLNVLLPLCRCVERTREVRAVPLPARRLAGGVCCM